MRRSVLTLLVTGCVLAVAGCGGSGGAGNGGASEGAAVAESKPVDAKLYARSVCSAIGAWQDALGQASVVFAHETQNEKDLAKVRVQFVHFFGGAIDETDRMLAKVEAAGVPNVTSGKKVSRSMLRELRSFRPILVHAQAKARRLPVANEARFTTQAQTLGAQFQIASAILPTLFDALGEQYKVPALAAAARADAACRRL